MSSRSRILVGVAALVVVVAVSVVVLVSIRDGEEPDARPEPSTTVGSLERVAYETAHDPDEDGTVDKAAIVYVPPGYDPDSPTRHDVVYLMHGATGDETSWLGSPSDPSPLPALLDGMIADDLIPPTIVVAPTFDTAIDTIDRNVDAFHEELVDDLIPRVEGRYRTYAEGIAPADLAAARDHRVFGGFSMGGVTTWHTFVDGLDHFAGFLPMSADSWSRGKLGGRDEPEATARDLAEAVARSGLDRDDYAIFAATGTKDWAHGPMRRQVAAMGALTDAFDLTQDGFADGNLMFHVVDGNTHDYEAGYDYVRAGLPRLLAR